MSHAGRTVTLVLASPEGSAIGSLPAFPVETPWWQDLQPVVRGARERFGADVVVLRILHAERASPPGGPVTYLAEVERPVAAIRPWGGHVDDHPSRMPWARPGGPRTDLAWADAELSARRRPRTGPAEQLRSWNLSSLWRLPVDGGAVWLKHVPPFFAHESAVIERLASPFVPTLVAADGARCLLEDLPGEDQYDAGIEILAAAVNGLVALQVAWSGRIAELRSLGLPDWRALPLTALIADAVARTADALTREDRATLDAWLATLPERFERVAACGIPDSLVHGDFAGGNLRGDGHRIVLLDWGDSGVGHPLLDQAAMIERAPADVIAPLLEHWAAAWQAAVPGSDPARAARLLAPVAAARQAVIYRGFLDRIEPSERPYHAADPAIALARTAGLVLAETAWD